MEGKLYKNVTLDENSVEYHHVMNLFNTSSPSYKSIISVSCICVCDRRLYYALLQHSLELGGITFNKLPAS